MLVSFRAIAAAGGKVFVMNKKALCPKSTTDELMSPHEEGPVCGATSHHTHTHRCIKKRSELSVRRLSLRIIK